MFIRIFEISWQLSLIHICRGDKRVQDALHRFSGACPADSGDWDDLCLRRLLGGRDHAHRHRPDVHRDVLFGIWAD